MQQTARSHPPHVETCRREKGQQPPGIPGMRSSVCLCLPLSWPWPWGRRPTLSLTPTLTTQPSSSPFLASVSPLAATTSDEHTDTHDHSDQLLLLSPIHTLTSWPTMSNFTMINPIKQQSSIRPTYAISCTSTPRTEANLFYQQRSSNRWRWGFLFRHDS